MGAGIIRQRTGETEQELLLVPAEDDPKHPLRPLPIALWVHGASGQEFEPMAWSHVHMITNAGFIVVSADWTSAYHWGNDAMIAQIDEVIADLRMNGYATEDPIITIGQSMGNVGSLNWALQNQSDWRGHINLVGVWNVDNVHADNRWSLTEGIDLAYGGSWANFTEKDQHSPHRYINTLKPVPMYSVHGTADTAALEVETQAAMADWPGTITDIEVIDGTHANTSEQINRPLLKEWIEAFNYGHNETLSVISREGWNADESLMTWEPAFYPIQKITVHHTDTANNDSTPENTIRAIYGDHATQYGDIAYLYLIDQQGVIYQGRYTGGEAAYNPVSMNEVVTGAHTAPWNSGNLGIGLLGSFTTEEPTAAAWNTLRYLLSEITLRHNMDPQGVSDFVNPVSGDIAANMPNISSHRDWPSTSTLCPGDAFYAKLVELRSEVAAINAGGTIAPPPAPEPGTVVALQNVLYPARPSNVGPLNINGELYTFLISGNTDQGDVRVLKSIDGATWTDQGYWNKGADAIQSLWIDVDELNNLVRVLIQDVGGYVAYKAYDLATDAWSTFAGQGWTTTATNFSAGIAVRSDGTSVGFYQGSPENGYARAAYGDRNSSGTWTQRGVLSGTGAAAHYYFNGAVLGANDVVHSFYKSGSTLYHRAILTDSTMGAEQVIATDVSADDVPTSNPVFDGTDIQISYINTDGMLVNAIAPSGVTPPWETTPAVSDQAVAVYNGGAVAASTLLDREIKTMYADAATSDMWITGDPDIEMLDAVTTQRMSMGTDNTNLLVLFDNAGTPSFVVITL